LAEAAGTPTLIAGAGATGLGAAMGLSQRGRPSELIDPRALIGGMAATRRVEGLPLKAGIHLLHPSTDHLRPLAEELVALMGDKALRVHPSAAIHFLGHELSYPFKSRELARALGPRRLAEVVASALEARVTRASGAITSRLPRLGRGLEREAPPDSFETVVREAYGERFYALFFRDYTAKVLGLPPDEVSGTWARRRVPMPSSRNLLQSLFPWWRPPKVEHPHSPFHRAQVTGPDGMGALFDAMLQEGTRPATLRLGSHLERVQLDERGVSAVILGDEAGAERRVETRELISTIPLPQLVAALDPVPPVGIVDAAQRLRFRGLVFVFVVLRGAPLFRSQWTYHQDPALCFNRLSEFGNFLPELYGPDHTVVCAEITADPGEEAWEDEELTIARCLSDLQAVSPRPLRAAITETHVHREEHAYPAWRVGFEDDLARVLDAIDGVPGLVTAGRQGRYDYLNIDEAIAAGLDAAAQAAR
jgi:protoporphyrinogen oxidase